MYLYNLDDVSYYQWLSCACTLCVCVCLQLPTNQGIWIAGYGMSVGDHRMVDVERESSANENSNMILIRVHLTMHIMHPIICMCVRMSISMYHIDICLAMKQ